jgi:hypothetical protein
MTVFGWLAASFPSRSDGPGPSHPTPRAGATLCLPALLLIPIRIWYRLKGHR